MFSQTIPWTPYSQNKTKVGLKAINSTLSMPKNPRQNKTKVGLKDRTHPSQTPHLSSQNKTKVGLKATSGIQFHLLSKVRIRLR